MVMNPFSNNLETAGGLRDIEAYGNRAYVAKYVAC